MITKVQKWGNSLAVRIPSAIAKENQLHSGAAIKLSSHDGQIVIALVREQRYRLADLLKGVSQENLQGEVSCGDAVGREEW